MHVRHCIIPCLIASILSIGLYDRYIKISLPIVSKATTRLYPTKGNTVTGIVIFEQESNGVRIKGTFEGLKPGKHGFHIHEMGDCTCDDAQCAGGHYNPTHQPHGAPDATERHVGDFGNIEADENGTAMYDRLDTVVKLNGPTSIIGRGVIVHADPDDFSQPVGNAGARVACGVIGIAS